MIIDPYGRPVTSIRVSVTQKCNLNCFYCHHEGEDDASSRSGEMSPDEIERILTVVSSFGIGRVKLTGGEPLMLEGREGPRQLRLIEKKCRILLFY